MKKFFMPFYEKTFVLFCFSFFILSFAFVIETLRKVLIVVSELFRNIVKKKQKGSNHEKRRADS